MQAAGEESGWSAENSEDIAFIIMLKDVVPCVVAVFTMNIEYFLFIAVSVSSFISHVLWEIFPPNIQLPCTHSIASCIHTLGHVKRKRVTNIIDILLFSSGCTGSELGVPIIPVCEYSRISL